MSARVYAGGVLVESWDDATRTHTDHATDPPTTRSYSAAENTAADVQTAAAARAANEAALRDGLQAVIDTALTRQTEMQAVLDTTDRTTASLAVYVKTVARATKRQDRAVITLARLAGALLDSASTGTD